MSVYEIPWRMAPDNFTPPTRTPWGGRVILDRLKSGLDLDAHKASYPVVGESWEISVEPSFPSRVVSIEGAPLLGELIEADPVAALGAAAETAFGGCPLLVKLLDARLALSVQVHPSDDYEKLADDESGKPESWIVVAAVRGAGLYLGFRDGVRRDDVARALEQGADLEPLMNFVPVAAGDCFEIGPGTVHAIGPGVTLVEPQTVRPGRKGVTYRFWDWNRGYDAAGRPDPAGQPRALHVADSLAVTAFDGPRGEALVEGLRRRPVLVERRDRALRERWIDAAAFRVERVRGSGRLDIEVDRLMAGVLIEGRARCLAGGETLALRRGESFVLPRASARAALELCGATLILSAPGC